MVLAMSGHEWHPSGLQNAARKVGNLPAMDALVTACHNLFGRGTVQTHHESLVLAISHNFLEFALQSNQLHLQPTWHGPTQRTLLEASKHPIPPALAFFRPFLNLPAKKAKEHMPFSRASTAASASSA